MRVAITQFATSLNTQENLASCVGMINKAAACEPALIILPELCNTSLSPMTTDTEELTRIQPYAIDHNQTWNAAVTINGAFLQQISQQAIKHHCYILLNVSMRRDLKRDHENSTRRSNISITSCLISPQGDVISQTNKQTLSAHEKSLFVSTELDSDLIALPKGVLGVLIGNRMRSNAGNSVYGEQAKNLARNGAQLLCKSKNYLGSVLEFEESNLHELALAYDNNVFVASANKIALATKNQSLTQDFSVTTPSQIVSPKGQVLAKIAHNEEGFAFAELDLAAVGVKNRIRPDGTQLANQLRSERYINQVCLKPYTQPNVIHTQVPETANVAIFATYKSNEQALEDVCHYIENNLSDIIQLPELFFIADKIITNDVKQLIEIGAFCALLIEQISAVLRPWQYVCTSLVIDGTHQAVLINEHGLYAMQGQLHFCQRYQWTALGEQLNVIELPLEQGVVRLVMLTADDVHIPELVKLAALSNIQLLLVPFDIQEPNDVEISLLARAAEHNLCIVAASREKNFATAVIASAENGANKKQVKSQKSTGIIVDVVLANKGSKRQPANKIGIKDIPQNINVKHQHGKITKAVLHPIAAALARR